MNQLPTGAITFLFTDIEGSSQLWQDHPKLMPADLATHDRIMQKCITDNGGHIFKTMGDAFCAAFGNASSAASAALAAQFALAEEAWQIKPPLKARMALHTGMAEEREGDYFGQTLNRAARLLAAAHGGQILLSLATEELVRDHLPDPSDFLDLGSVRLKDLGRPEHVFQLRHPKLLADFPPLRSLDSTPNNLPQQATSFIGREKEIAQITELLGGKRLVTLVGMGGAGKTRLSLQAAADWINHYEDGIWFVELAPLSDPAFVTQAAAQALSIREEAGTPLQQTLRDLLKSKSLLLILDNCEHLVSACARLAADLLSHCPNVRILASSREPLNVAGEQIYRIPSLSSPDPKKRHTTSALTQYESVSLFIDRAKAAQSSFLVTDKNAPALAQICFHLDGIPLAIELAAARARSLSLEDLLARLGQRFRLLTGGARNLLPRQQTLRALIDWSYDLLTENEKTLLCRLNVFAGGCTLAAAEAVCAGEEIEDWEMLDLLTSLVDKSLAVYEECDGGGRYRLLETVRQYGQERLAEAGASDATSERLAAWALAFAEETQPNPRGSEAVSRLEMEHDNFSAALDWFEQMAQDESCSVEILEEWLRLCAALAGLWSYLGYVSEVVSRLQKVVHRTEDLPISRARIVVLSTLGIGIWNQADPLNARRYIEQAVELSRLLGDRDTVARGLSTLGSLSQIQGDFVRARAYYEEGLVISQEIGHQELESNALTGIGSIAFYQGDYAEAEKILRQCLLISRQTNNTFGIISNISWLGYTAFAQGNYLEAKMLHEETLILARLLDSPIRIAMSLQNLGKASQALGDYADANAKNKEALTIMNQRSHLAGTPYCLEGCAGVAALTGLQERGVRLWSAAHSLRTQMGAKLPLHEQEQQEREIADAHNSMGDEAFEAAWDAGKAMTLEEIVAYALSEEV